MIQEKLSSVNQNVIDIAENTLCLLDLLSLAVVEIKFLLSVMAMEPYLSFMKHLISLFFRLSYSKLFHFCKFTMCFAHNYNADCT